MSADTVRRRIAAAHSGHLKSASSSGIDPFVVVAPATANIAAGGGWVKAAQR